MDKQHPPVAFEDARGRIVDVVSREPLDAVTLITFTKGAVRANHYHKQTTQWNYVLSGSIRIVTQMPGAAPVEAVLKTGDLAVTVPEERHALQGLEDATLLVLTRGPRGGEDYESDTFRLETPLIRS